LDDILKSQRKSTNKVGLGYDYRETNKGSKSGIQKSDQNPKSYATSLQISFKKEENKRKNDSNKHKFILPSK
jgi:hypothetical protein